jgi:hypothetical protein
MLGERGPEMVTPLTGGDAGFGVSMAPVNLTINVSGGGDPEKIGAVAADYIGREVRAGRARLIEDLRAYGF